MTNYKAVFTEVALIKDSNGILSDTVTRVSIEDEGGGAFISISQPFNPNEITNTITLDPEEIKPVMNVALDLIEGYNKVISNIKEETKS